MGHSGVSNFNTGLNFDHGSILDRESIIQRGSNFDTGLKFAIGSNFEGELKFGSESNFDTGSNSGSGPVAGKMPLVFYEWRQSWLPELQHVDEPRGRQKFYARAIVHLLSREAVGRFSFLAWGVLFAEAAALLTLWFWLCDQFRIHIPEWVFVVVVIAIPGSVTSLIVETTLLLIGHRRASAFLRRDLSENGWPTCLECGYDLWGQEEHERERVCPECGNTWIRPERQRAVTPNS